MEGLVLKSGVAAGLPQSPVWIGSQKQLIFKGKTLRQCLTSLTDFTAYVEILAPLFLEGTTLSS